MDVEELSEVFHKCYKQHNIHQGNPLNLLNPGLYFAHHQLFHC
jgi:hypothetical protein